MCYNIICSLANNKKRYENRTKEVFVVSKVCEICGKGKVFGNKVTFSNKKSSRSWSPNIRTVRAVVNGSVKRVNVCTRCLRSGYVERAL